MSDNIHQLRPEPGTFEEFWRVYPLKKGKPLAQAKWDAITNGGLRTRTLDRDSGQYVEIELQASPAELIDGAQRYRDRQINRNTFQIDPYTCHPSTWLNQGRWLDG